MHSEHTLTGGTTSQQRLTLRVGVLSGYFFNGDNPESSTGLSITNITNAFPIASNHADRLISAIFDSRATQVAGLFEEFMVSVIPRVKGFVKQRKLKGVAGALGGAMIGSICPPLAIAGTFTAKKLFKRMNIGDPATEDTIFLAECISLRDFESFKYELIIDTLLLAQSDLINNTGDPQNETALKINAVITQHGLLNPAGDVEHPAIDRFARSLYGQKSTNENLKRLFIGAATMIVKMGLTYVNELRAKREVERSSRICKMYLDKEVSTLTRVINMFILGSIHSDEPLRQACRRLLSGDSSLFACPLLPTLQQIKTHRQKYSMGYHSIQAGMNDANYYASDIVMLCSINSTEEDSRIKAHEILTNLNEEESQIFKGIKTLTSGADDKDRKVLQQQQADVTKLYKAGQQVIEAQTKNSNEIDQNEAALTKERAKLEMRATKGGWLDRIREGLKRQSAPENEPQPERDEPEPDTPLLQDTTKINKFVKKISELEAVRADLQGQYDSIERNKTEILHAAAEYSAGAISATGDIQMLTREMITDNQTKKQDAIMDLRKPIQGYWTWPSWIGKPPPEEFGCKSELEIEMFNKGLFIPDTGDSGGNRVYESVKERKIKRLKATMDAVRGKPGPETATSDDYETQDYENISADFDKSVVIPALEAFYSHKNTPDLLEMSRGGEDTWRYNHLKYNVREYPCPSEGDVMEVRESIYHRNVEEFNQEDAVIAGCKKGMDISETVFYSNNIVVCKVKRYQNQSDQELVDTDIILTGADGKSMLEHHPVQLALDLRGGIHTVLASSWVNYYQDTFNKNILVPAECGPICGPHMINKTILSRRSYPEPVLMAKLGFDSFSSEGDFHQITKIDQRSLGIRGIVGYKKNEVDGRMATLPFMEDIEDKCKEPVLNHTVKTMVQELLRSSMMCLIHENLIAENNREEQITRLDAKAPLDEENATDPLNYDFIDHPNNIELWQYINSLSLEEGPLTHKLDIIARNKEDFKQVFKGRMARPLKSAGMQDNAIKLYHELCDIRISKRLTISEYYSIPLLGCGSVSDISSYIMRIPYDNTYETADFSDLVDSQTDVADYFKSLMNAMMKTITHDDGTSHTLPFYINLEDLKETFLVTIDGKSPRCYANVVRGFLVIMEEYKHESESGKEDVMIYLHRIPIPAITCKYNNIPGDLQYVLEVHKRPESPISFKKYGGVFEGAGTSFTIKAVGDQSGLRARKDQSGLRARKNVDISYTWEYTTPKRGRSGLSSPYNKDEFIKAINAIETSPEGRYKHGPVTVYQNYTWGKNKFRLAGGGFDSNESVAQWVNDKHEKLVGSPPRYARISQEGTYKYPIQSENMYDIPTCRAISLGKEISEQLTLGYTNANDSSDAKRIAKAKKALEAWEVILPEVDIPGIGTQKFSVKFDSNAFSTQTFAQNEAWRSPTKILQVNTSIGPGNGNVHVIGEITELGIGPAPEFMRSATKEQLSIPGDVQEQYDLTIPNHLMTLRQEISSMPQLCGICNKIPVDLEGQTVKYKLSGKTKVFNAANEYTLVSITSPDEPPNLCIVLIRQDGEREITVTIKITPGVSTIRKSGAGQGWASTEKDFLGATSLESVAISKVSSPDSKEDFDLETTSIALAMIEGNSAVLNNLLYAMIKQYIDTASTSSFNTESDQGDDALLSDTEPEQMAPVPVPDLMEPEPEL
jgi:hypothetical protein